MGGTLSSSIRGEPGTAQVTGTVPIAENTVAENTVAENTVAGSPAGNDADADSPAGNDAAADNAAGKDPTADATAGDSSDGSPAAVDPSGTSPTDSTSRTVPTAAGSISTLADDRPLKADRQAAPDDKQTALDEAQSPIKVGRQSAVGGAVVGPADRSPKSGTPIPGTPNPAGTPIPGTPNPAGTPIPAGRSVPVEPVELVRTWLPDATWELHTGPRWSAVLPPDHVERTQGWTLHISATPDSVADVIARILPVLEEHQVPFTFASTLSAVRKLTSGDCERSLSGKVVTVYPNDDGDVAPLAEDLHARTEGLDGPRILSDRQFCAGSVVHYRFGAFAGVPELDDDGVFVNTVVAPDGLRVADRGDTWLAPPPWAGAPFEPPVSRTQPTEDEADSHDDGARDETQATEPADRTRPHGPGVVLLDDRFLVRRALRQSPRGGVYRSYDRETGMDVVVKHARAHVDVAVTGTDARDRLRHHAAMLRLLAGEVPVPQVIKLFEQQGDLFLAEELLPGESFGTWVRSTSGQTSYVSVDQVLVTARHLVAMVAGVHAAGVVLRDLSPPNIVVGPNGALALVDLGAAADGGPVAPVAGRVGYQAPECGSDQEPTTPQATEDQWSLGALLFLLVTGNDPVLPDDDPAERTLHDRLAAWLTAVAVENPAAGVLTPPILGLLASQPDRRWSLARVEKYLAVHADVAAGGKVVPGTGRFDATAGRRGSTRSHSGTPVLPAPTAERLLADGLDHLLATMAEPDSERLWPTSGFGARTDPGNVQHGVAGILGVLLQALDQAAEPDQIRLLAAVRRGASWLAAHEPARDPERPLPGLYFGESGRAWALADAGLALQDVRLVEQAVDLLLGLSTRWSSPDIAHGLAGAGLAHLHVARNVPDPRLLDRVLEYADTIVAAAEEGTSGPVWPIPADAPSRLAGACHYGFAHGVAGIGYFLLAAGTETGNESYVKIALEAGRTLCRLAETDSQGAAWWPVGPHDNTLLPHWCSGSSGIGTFLLRLYAATDEPAIGAYAGAAAVAVHRSRWQSLPSSCHGLAGNGQLLLDAAHLLDDATYADWSDDLVEAMAVRHCRRGGRLLIPDETGYAVRPDYQTGLAGVVSFLLRLQNGGPRPWMADDLLDVNSAPDPQPVTDP